METAEKDICTELWDTHKDRIHQICSIKLQSCPNEVEDVVSEVFLALCKKVSESEAPEKPKEWLYGTLNNLLNKTYRGVYAARENETPLPENEFELPYMYDEIDSKETEMYVEQLRKACDLNDDEQKLLDLFYNKRFRNKEIAAMQASTESAIKQKHYRTIRKLRKTAKKVG